MTIHVAHDVGIPTDLQSREYFDRRLKAMRMVHQNFVPHYKELSEFVQPRKGRFFVDDVDRGTAAYQAIINSQATQALRTARSGLFAGTMSPARPWFRYVIADTDLMERQNVKIWLENVETLVRDIFNQGNLYTMAPVMLGELLLFGTGCMTHLDDFQDVSRFYTHTIGSYLLAQNDRFVIDTLAREYKRSVRQLVSQFGLNNISIQARNMWDRSDYDQMVPVVSFIEPNPDAKDGGVFQNSMPFRSVHYEQGQQDKKFLGIAGFQEFPAYCPRWEVTGEDTYGNDCPGMTALGDVKGLQVEERRKAQGLEKVVNPPLHGPATLLNVPSSSLPGSLTTYEAQGTHVLRSIYDVKLQLGELVQDIEKVEGRIDRAFYTDLFKAITNMEGIQPRNKQELFERNEERLLELGPVLERVHGDFLARMVTRQRLQAERAGILPPMPEELRDHKLDVRFISSLAMAQRAVAVGGIERIAGFAGNLAAVWPNAPDKLDADQMIDEYGKAIGVPARVIVPDDVLKEKREEAAKAQQMQQMQEAVKAMGPTAVQGAQVSVNSAKEQGIT